MKIFKNFIISYVCGKGSKPTLSKDLECVCSEKHTTAIKKRAFTLTEMLLAILIVGIISGLVLPAVITRFQNNILNHAFEREKQSLADLINQLAVDEHAGNFHNTIMYLEPKKDDDDSEYDFENSSGVFLNKYLRVSKYCGTGKGDCFAPVYYSHEKKGVKKVFDFKPEGSCAILKNGMSLCIKPQIGDTPIQGWIDLNGKKGPNVLNRDLREFSLDLQEKAAFNQATRKIRNYCADNPEAEVCGGDTDESPSPSSPSSPPPSPSSPPNRDNCDSWVSDGSWSSLPKDIRDGCCRDYGFYMYHKSKNICTCDKTDYTISVTMMHNENDNAHGICRNESSSCYYKIQKPGTIRDEYPISIELACCDASCPGGIPRWQDTEAGRSAQVQRINAVGATGTCMTGRCKFNGAIANCSSYTFSVYSGYRAVDN